MIRRTLRKLVYGLRTRLHASGKEQVIVVGGRRIGLVRGGEGPPVLFLHSLAGETRWLPFHQRLAKRFDVIAPAFPGYGATEGLDDVDAVEDLVFHVLDVLEALELRRVHVVGVSLGAWIAAELAVRHPDRIDRLVVADALGVTDESVDFGATPEVSRGAFFADPRGPMADLIAKSHPDWSGRAAAMLRRLGGTSSKLARRLRRVTCPTLVVWGEADRLAPMEAGETLRDGIHGATLVVLPGSGHLPHFEQEALFVETVATYLAGG